MPKPELSILQKLFSPPIENIDFRSALTQWGWYKFKSSILPEDFYNFFIENTQLVDNWLYYSRMHDGGSEYTRGRPKFAFCSKNKVYFSYGYSGLILGTLCEPRTSSPDPFLPAAYYVFRLCHSFKSKEERVAQICEIPKLLRRGEHLSLSCILQDSGASVPRYSLNDIQNHLMENPGLIEDWLNIVPAFHFFSEWVGKVSDNPPRYQYSGRVSDPVIYEDPSFPVAKYIRARCDLRS